MVAEHVGEDAGRIGGGEERARKGEGEKLHPNFYFGGGVRKFVILAVFYSSLMSNMKRSRDPEAEEPDSAALKAAFKVSKDSCTCSICTGLFEVAVQTGCGHTFCRACLLGHAVSDDKKCPLCNALLCKPVDLPAATGGFSTRLRLRIATWPEVMVFRGLCESVRAVEPGDSSSSEAAECLLRFLRGSYLEGSFDMARFKALAAKVTNPKDVNITDERGRTLLMLMVERANFGEKFVVFDTARGLAARVGADISLADSKGETFLTLLASKMPFVLPKNGWIRILKNHTDVLEASSKGTLPAVVPGSDLTKAFLRACSAARECASGNYTHHGTFLAAFLKTQPEFVSLIKPEDKESVYRALGAGLCYECALE